MVCLFLPLSCSTVHPAYTDIEPSLYMANSVVVPTDAMYRE